MVLLLCAAACLCAASSRRRRRSAAAAASKLLGDATGDARHYIISPDELKVLVPAAALHHSTTTRPSTQHSGDWSPLRAGAATQLKGGASGPRRLGMLDEDSSDSGTALAVVSGGGGGQGWARTTMDTEPADNAADAEAIVIEYRGMEVAVVAVGLPPAWEHDPSRSSGAAAARPARRPSFRPQPAAPRRSSGSSCQGDLLAHQSSPPAAPRPSFSGLAAVGGGPRLSSGGVVTMQAAGRLSHPRRISGRRSFSSTPNLQQAASEAERERRLSHILGNGNAAPGGSLLQSSLAGSVAELQGGGVAVGGGGAWALPPGGYGSSLQPATRSSSLGNAASNAAVVPAAAAPTALERWLLSLEHARPLEWSSTNLADLVMLRHTNIVRGVSIITLRIASRAPSRLSHTRSLMTPLLSRRAHHHHHQVSTFGASVLAGRQVLVQEALPLGSLADVLSDEVRTCAYSATYVAQARR